MTDLKDIFNKENPHRESAPETNTEEFKKVLKSRRSVRKYSPKKIPAAVMHDVLDMALLAPNSSNLQPWEFYWIRSKEKRELANAAFLSQPAATTAAEIIVAVARTKTWKAHAKKMIALLEANDSGPSATVYYKKIVPLVYSLGFLNFYGFIKKFLFFFRGLSKATPREITNKCELQIWAVKSTALACENIMLSLRAYGYDSCPMEGFDSARLSKLLDLPKDAIIVMGISAGERAEDGVYGQQLRFTKENFVFEI